MTEGGEDKNEKFKLGDPPPPAYKMDIYLNRTHALKKICIQFEFLSAIVRLKSDMPIGSIDVFLFRNLDPTKKPGKLSFFPLIKWVGIRGILRRFYTHFFSNNCTLKIAATHGLTSQQKGTRIIIISYKIAVTVLAEFSISRFLHRSSD